jgi:hypothetical protein
VNQQKNQAHGSLRRQLRMILLFARLDAFVTGFAVVAFIAACAYFRMHGRPFASLAMALLVGITVALRLPRNRQIAEDEPSGVYLHEDESPELFAVADELCGAFDRRVPDAIYLGHTCDLFLGRLNGSRYLYIGMPLLYSLSSEQLRILLALAVARTCSSDANVLARAESVQQTCSKWTRKSRRHSAALVSFGFTALLTSYSSTLAGLSVQLKQHREEKALAQVSEMFSTKQIGTALIRAALAQRCFHELWSDACLQLRCAEEPHRRIYTLFASDLKDRIQRLTPSVVRDVLYLPERGSTIAEQLLSLGLGYEQHFQLVTEAKSPIASYAARTLLAEGEPEVRSRMEEHWFAATSPSWELIHQDMVEAERANA